MLAEKNITIPPFRPYFLFPIMSNNIFLNLEGSLDEKTDFIIEYQPLTSDLYLLGGFLTIAFPKSLLGATFWIFSQSCFP
jgi:hypothetical protein